MCVRAMTLLWCERGFSPSRASRCSSPPIAHHHPPPNPCSARTSSARIFPVSSSYLRNFLRRYGMAEFSMRNLMASAIRDDVWDLPECSLVGLFWEDKIHPSRNQGHLMIADALMRYLERSAVYYDGLSAEGPAEGSADRGGVRGRAGMRRPHVPVNEGAWDVPPRRCFSHDTKGGIPVDVSASRGWNLTDEGRGKPGWVSTAMGDRLSIRLDTASMDGDGHVTVTLTYLQSYEGAKRHCPFTPPQLHHPAPPALSSEETSRSVAVFAYKRMFSKAMTTVGRNPTPTAPIAPTLCSTVHPATHPPASPPASPPPLCCCRDGCRYPLVLRGVWVRTRVRGRPERGEQAVRGRLPRGQRDAGAPPHARHRARHRLWYWRVGRRGSFLL